MRRLANCATGNAGANRCETGRTSLSSAINLSFGLEQRLRKPSEVDPDRSTFPTGSQSQPVHERETILIALSGILVLGIGSQWLASRLKIPSILVLLSTGILAGPVAGFINPDQLLGELVLPIVSLAVAVVLFEGSMSLRISELREIGKP